MNNKKILITTGVYPPKIGGPAQYTKKLKEELEKLGYKINVITYGQEEKLPTGVRHMLFFFKIMPNIWWSEAVFALDTFSVGLPTVIACKIFGKKCIIRTGGDFLWEQYVERTKKKVLLKNFYKTEISGFSIKEKIILKATRMALKMASKVIFSTEWQRDIFAETYGLDLNKTGIIENFYGLKEADEEYDQKLFLASSRKIFLKNFDVIKTIFSYEKIKSQRAVLEGENMTFEEFMSKMRKCYAVIAVSFSEVSPNIILDAIRLNRPFICTKEVGIFERIKDVGIFVDPLNEKEIEEAVLYLLTDKGYKEAKEKVRNFNFIHTWEEIAKEFAAIA